MNNLDNIKAGDRVIVHSYGYLRVATVDRVTPTQIIVGHSKYRRKNGNAVGGGIWGADFISRAEGENLKVAERETKAYEAAALKALCAAHKTLKAISK